ncbi:fimbria/pilus periplasmic chaperone [Paraburkholderia sp. MMS20-SJTN17]|uniref:Fimbria/pilus periplasmic chaperone n=1 Tax=Paraburkholderia translucens TaxID=2886945 RepID=A0ABS8KA16_9BURK|nr:fimbria/pilus periplasmic chaperone [Paraburkholderia sp. MMS20-SJTN17]MCC8401575.1 fimbria/pilus periplasmic chaperone [Paraburkholderia sp. MMS20-SJTN17]
MSMHSMRSLVQPPLLRGVWSAAAIVAAVGGAAPAQAAAILQVAPVRMEFQPTQQGQTIQIANKGQDAVEAQVRIMRWTQEDGQDHLSPAASSELVVSPPIMHIAPGHQQTVRVIRLHPTTPASELSYRLLIDELPHQSVPHGTGLRLLMRYSLPIFVNTTPTPPVPRPQHGATVIRTDLSNVHAQVAAGQDGKAELRVENDGNHAIRISALSTVASGGQTQSVDGGLVGYVLSGQHMRWPLNVPYPLPPGMTLKARFDDDTEAQAVPMDGAGR